MRVNVTLLMKALMSNVETVFFLFQAIEESIILLIMVCLYLLLFSSKSCE